MDYLLDLDSEGLIDKSTGKLIEVKNIDAINNALIMFIQLQSGETIENEGLDSPLYTAIGKPLSNYQAETISDLLYITIDTYFTPKLQITELKVVPNIQDESWEITISGIVDILEIEASVSLTLSNSI